jgi:transposase InsO family protein
LQALVDFVADQLQDGTHFRSLTIVDVFTREAVGIEVGQSLKGDDVVRILNRLKLDRYARYDFDYSRDSTKGRLLAASLRRGGLSR